MDPSPLLTSPNLQSLLAASNATKSEVLSLLSDPAAPAKPPTKASNARQTQLSTPRGQHRKTMIEVRDTKAETASARAEVDKLHLQLQNLLYERAHLRSEILACESYEYALSLLLFLAPNSTTHPSLGPPRPKPFPLEIGHPPTTQLNTTLTFHSHTHLSLPLLPLESFLDLHPELIDADPHEIMVKRIEHEHGEREALESQRQGLLKKKQGLIADNKRRKEDLASLDADLERFIDAAKPIREVFGRDG